MSAMSTLPSPSLPYPIIETFSRKVGRSTPPACRAMPRSSCTFSMRSSIARRTAFEYFFALFFAEKLFFR